MGMKTDTGTERVIDADKDPDEVSRALSLDDADEPQDESDQQDSGSDEDTDDDDEVTLDDVIAELRELKRDNAKLKREAAARRVADKSKSKGTATDGEGETETVEQARERGKEEARLEFGLELAEASIRSSLTGIIPDADLDDFVDDLRIERYVGEDGKPDRDAIKALRDRQAKITRRRPAARTGNGRTNGIPQQKSKSDVMSEMLTPLGL